VADEDPGGKRDEKRRGSRARGGNGANVAREEVRDVTVSRRYWQLAQAIGERIRAVRVAQRRSRAHLARSADLADSHLGEIERGEIAPGSSTLAKLAVALGVEAGAIFPDLPALTLLVGLEIGHDEQRSAMDAPAVEHGEPGELGGYDQVVGQSRHTGQSGRQVLDPAHGEGREGGKTRVGLTAETLLSPAVVARMAHVEARTLQKWIAQGLVTPSFYVMQEARSPKEGAPISSGQEASRSAAFRHEDLASIIEVRNRARVRQRGHAEQVQLEGNDD
jgi:transcriptional regulator with XRE-family HTH domain